MICLKPTQKIFVKKKKEDTTITFFWTQALKRKNKREKKIEGNRGMKGDEKSKKIYR